MLLICCLSGCFANEPPPALGKDIEGGIQQVSSTFDQRLKQRFPVGSDESALRTELAAEGFHIVDRDDAQTRQVHRYSADYSNANLVCREHWWVYWTADTGKITSINGDYSSVCS